MVRVAIRLTDLVLFFEILIDPLNSIRDEVEVKGGVTGLNQCPDAPEQVSSKSEFSDLTEKDEGVIIERDFMPFIIPPMSQIVLQPLQLELLIRVQGWIIDIDTCELTEMVRNVECLVVEVSILKIDESDSLVRRLMVNNVLEKEIIVTEHDW